MSLNRRIAFLLALGTLALPLANAQSAGSKPSDQTKQSTQQSNSGAATVQQRIKLRREQRRQAAIHEAYNHMFDVNVGGGYLRFTPGSTLQRTNQISWDLGVTRYYNERFGISFDGRGYSSDAFVQPKAYNQNVTRPTVSEYAVMAGPSYRLYLDPRFSVAVRAMGGWAYGDFSQSTSGNQALSTYLGLYKDGSSYAGNASVLVDYNVSPNLALRVAPDFQLTGFGSTTQPSLGYQIGVVYRFGKSK